MDLSKGVDYNLRGLWLGIRSPKLLLLGLIRFAVVILITVISSSLILIYHQEILNLIWQKPESFWVIWLWHLISWLLSLFLVGISSVLSYLISQILFSVVIMDQMSRITERKLTGKVEQPAGVPMLRQFFYLLKQEIPRTTLPAILCLLVMVLGWLVPLGPILVFIASGLFVIFLSWDNTDLIPARRLMPFRDRLRFLLKNLSFHLGFGLLFLIPGLNILFLSFAPVGATLYYLDTHDGRSSSTPLE
jgi:CysZ protein